MIRVLFLCIGNSARSQMAEGFARSLAGDRIEIFSAGSKPADTLEHLAVKAMAEKGIDISPARPKGFDKIPAGVVDYVVSMGCGDTCPAVPAKQYIEWHIPDPKGKDIEVFRDIRDKIEQQVQKLFNLITGKGN
ncbi:MAG: arsenate reductase ArsC [Planctomycetes bacterium]|nr:arsenate reductase ArsC [Planctomycetota bacterium]